MKWICPPSEKNDNATFDIGMLATKLTLPITNQLIGYLIIIKHPEHFLKLSMKQLTLIELEIDPI